MQSMRPICRPLRLWPRTFTGLGACSFFVRPSLTAAQTTIFWSPETDTSTVLLERLPDFLPAGDNLATSLQNIEARRDLLGHHFVHRAGGRTFHALRLDGADDAPLMAMIPLDVTGFDRLAETEQLLRALLDLSVAPDGRLTPQQLRRARHMLQAVDGRRAGASYREIAEVLYGAKRVRAEHWKTSPLRANVIGLVKGGLAMIAGGYRQLLRHRRKK